MTRNEPTLSVVVRTRNEADRLRLVLSSLEGQTSEAEVVVVDDGSTDHTADVLREAEARFGCRTLTHPTSLGRSTASNAGARLAQGDIVLFLDGDTLAAPDLVARHRDVHQVGGDLMARGETWNIRATRPLLDPEALTPQPGFEARVADASPSEKAAMQVTRAQIRTDFAAVAKRGQPGVYPGFGPRRLFELEMDALRNHPDCSVLWAAASGSNFSVRRDRFLAAGGFLDEMDLNAHRELALRMVKRGSRIGPASGARTYHLIHRTGWRDPLTDQTWQQIFFRDHPEPATRLVLDFWAGFSDGGTPTILSLPDLASKAAAAEGASP